MTETAQAEMIFGDAIEIASPEKRQAFLDRKCQDDPRLRQEVETLVFDYFRAGDFLERPLAEIAAPTCDQLITEKPGTLIGPYKLLQQIGDGGMGVVYMAEQKEPVKRRVALKIIKPGMDTRQVIARFEAERQALAMMDHPNIAKVLDAGATESGRPYFVMELVNGISVTRYCDEQHLTPKERLELFLPICQAVQHAHQKGIIHRDLKPSNIMVVLYDDQAVPKVIDFGVAKATGQTLADETMFTQLGQVVGTLEYMSPEQAQRNQPDIDTRSDIYSLGVLLYELLTGDTPFDRQRLRSAAFDEMLRIIREEEPLKPSTKVSSNESLPSIAANRSISAHKLGTMIRGELDWIVMKALEKDRNRRYESASAFMADIERYINVKPVHACPPTPWYRCRKFIWRNRRALTVVGLFGLALLTACGGLILIGRLKREQQRTFAAVSEVQENREFLDDVVYREHLTSVSLMALAKTYRNSDRLEDAEHVLELAAEINRNLAASAPELAEAGTRMDVLHGLEFVILQLAEIQRISGKLQSAEENYREAIAQAERLVVEYPDRQDFGRELTYARLGLAKCLLSKLSDSNSTRLDHLLKVELALRESLQLLDQLAGEHWQQADYSACQKETRERLGWCLVLKGRALLDEHAYTQAESTLQEALALFQQLPEEDRKSRQFRERMCTTYGKLCQAYEQSGRLNEAAEAALDAFAVKESLIVDFPEVTIYQHWRSHAVIARRLVSNLLQNSDSSPTHDPALAINLARIPLKYRQDLGKDWAMLGAAFYRAQQHSNAVDALQEAVAKKLDPGERCQVHLLLAMAYWQLGKRKEAAVVLNQAVTWMEENLPDSEGLDSLRMETEKLMGTQD